MGYDGVRLPTRKFFDVSSSLHPCDRFISMTKVNFQGEAETEILRLAQESKGQVQSCVTKSGFINSPGRVRPNVTGLPLIEVRDIIAAMLDQILNGFENDTLSNDDLRRIGKKALGEQQDI